MKDKFKKSILFLLALTMGISLFACGTQENSDSQSSGGAENSASDYIPGDSSDNSSNEDPPDGNQGDQTAPPTIDYSDYVDFLVNVPETRDPIVLHISDPQIMPYGWVGDGSVTKNCYNYIEETVEATDPDLIILTGDLVYGHYDENGYGLRNFINFMETLETPWAPVFGNHDNESAVGVDWQCDRLEEAEYCLFEQRTLTGNGNYSVGIVQGDRLTRVFYMLDSNGCTGASAASLANGHTVTSVGFGADQIEWYTEAIENVHSVSPSTKISFAYHIQQYAFKNAYAKYGFTNSGTKNNPINIDTHPNKTDGDFGYIGRDLKTAWDTDYTVYNGMKALGVDSIFVGHEHCNSASVVHDGIRFQFGQKCSMYDRLNFRQSDGSIAGIDGSEGTGDPILGGSVLPLSKEDGSIKDPYIYYCKV